MVYNVEESMSKDMKSKNIQSNPWAFASEAELDALEKLAKLQSAKQDEADAKIKKAEELKKKLKLADEA